MHSDVEYFVKRDFSIPKQFFFAPKTMKRNRESEIRGLSKIDETSRKLQEDGFDQEALDCLQLGLLKRRDLFGAKSEEILLECKRVGQVFNDIAGKNVIASNFDKALEYLKHAMKIVRKEDKDGILLTLQNFAECYRKMGNLTTATRYLRQAMDAQSELNARPDELARSNLNICANLSLLGNHEGALRHAEIAIDILRRDIRDSISPGEHSEREQLEKHVISEYDSDSISISHEGDNVTYADPKYMETVAVAYYNAGVECEHLGDIKKCYHLFQQGNEVAQSLGVHHAITKVLNESSQAIVKKIVRLSVQA